MAMSNAAAAVFILSLTDAVIDGFWSRVKGGKDQLKTEVYNRVR